MINPITHLLFLAAAWLVYGLAGQRRPELILSLFGVAFLGFYAPVAMLWIAFTALEASLIVRLLEKHERTSNLRQFLPYVVLINLLFVELHPKILLVSVETLAISFSTIRIFMTAKQLLALRDYRGHQEIKWIWAAAFYLPALIVGPVFSGTELRKEAVTGQQADLSAQTIRFLIAGIVTVLLINPFLLLVARRMNGSPQTIDLGWEGAPIFFVILFTGFYGQSLIAEYSSRMFGRTLPHNFDMPWRAANIRDFWQRWHRSMANFVMQYIFLPLNMRGVNPRLATIAAFVFMGLWHNLSAGYLVWGFMHGSLLAFWPKQVKGKAWPVIERIVTWLAVIGLSYVANYSWLA